MSGVELAGLRCPNCGHLAYDHGGGRAHWQTDEKTGIPLKRCATMVPVTLIAFVKEDVA